MGMTDRVTIKPLFCPFCGHLLSETEFGTKAAERKLNTYHSREEFESAHPEVKSYDIGVSCTACGENFGLTIHNVSPECLADNEEKSKEYWKKANETSTERETSAHPNHNYRPGYHLSNGHCLKCAELKVKSGDLPPDAAPELIEHQRNQRADAPRRQREFFERWPMQEDDQ